MMIGMANGLMDQNIEVGVEKKVGTITIGGVTYDRYVKIVNWGEGLPNTATSVSKDLTFDFVGILDYHAIAKTNNSSVPFIIKIPWIGANSNNNVVLLVNYDAKTMRLTTFADMSLYTEMQVFFEYYR